MTEALAGAAPGLLAELDPRLRPVERVTAEVRLP